MAEQLRLRMGGAPFDVLERRSADPADLAFWYELVYSAWKHAAPKPRFSAASHAGSGPPRDQLS